MAKKQTRRCVSLSQGDYDASKLEAARRGMTLTALVEDGLAAVGVAVVPHPQQTPELAARSASRRAAGTVTKQARRCVSLNRSDYEAAKQEAARRGMALTTLVAAGLAALGVAATPPQQIAALGAPRAPRRATRVAPPSLPPKLRPSRERQLFGDQFADTHGFQ
jgi:predicted DNA binding CopG/RHH family protein